MFLLKHLTATSTPLMNLEQFNNKVGLAQAYAMGRIGESGATLAQLMIGAEKMGGDWINDALGVAILGLLERRFIEASDPNGAAESAGPGKIVFTLTEGGHIFREEVMK
jgi:hypothetical protein